MRVQRTETKTEPGSRGLPDTTGGIASAGVHYGEGDRYKGPSKHDPLRLMRFEAANERDSRDKSDFETMKATGKRVDGECASASTRM
jgi:hypothetical protein